MEIYSENSMEFGKGMNDAEEEKARIHNKKKEKTDDEKLSDLKSRAKRLKNKNK